MSAAMSCGKLLFMYPFFVSPEHVQEEIMQSLFLYVCMYVCM